MGEGAHTSIELSHPPTPPTLDICIDLACKPIGFHVVLSSQPSSSSSFDPPDCTVLCSPVSVSTLIFHKDQVVNRVGVEQPTCAIIYDEYVWESKEEPVMKDDLLLS